MMGNVALALETGIFNGTSSVDILARPCQCQTAVTTTEELHVESRLTFQPDDLPTCCVLHMRGDDCCRFWPSSWRWASTQAITDGV
mmetsp:Transcript_146305/g.355095  ORF Transcript_146305/g.355095 Transcript_146305/m.355095 type:complete len:86 (-) Transcript_146305:25-282(-)